MLLWVVPSLARSLGSPSEGPFSGFVSAVATNITEAIPALMIIVAVAVIRTGRNRPPLLKWERPSIGILSCFLGAAWYLV